MPDHAANPAAGPVPARQALTRVVAIVTGYAAYVGLIGVLPPRSVATEASAAFAADPALAARGRAIWRERQCQACHSLYGLGGHTGPDLTNVVSRMSAEYVRHTVVSGLGTMPAFGLAESDAGAIAAFLASVDATGRYPPRNLAEPIFGAGR